MADKPVVPVTGAGSGLGVVVAQRLAADGYTVRTLDFNGHQGQEETP